MIYYDIIHSKHRYRETKIIYSSEECRYLSQSRFNDIAVALR